MSDFYNAVEEYREKNGLTIAEFERRCGLKHGTVRKWRVRGGDPRLSTLRKIADATGVSVITWIKEAQKETA